MFKISLSAGQKAELQLAAMNLSFLHHLKFYDIHLKSNIFSKL